MKCKNFIGIVFALLAVSCASTNENYSDESLENAVITLQRTACFGECPIYKLTITGNGLVTFEGQKYVKKTGTHTATIDKEQVRELIDAFMDAHYFNLLDRYEDTSVADAAGAMTSLSFDGKTKEIYRGFGNSETWQKLVELEKTIDRIAGSEQWIR